MPINNVALFVRSRIPNKDNTGINREKLSEAATHPQDLTPDIELMLLPATAMDHLAENVRLFSKLGIFSILATLVQPKSRGTVRLASAPMVDPKLILEFYLIRKIIKLRRLLFVFL